jgi:preprotein translocase subunit SecF
MHRYVFFAISTAVILAGLIVALVAGIKVDIQFQGGSILKYSFAGTVDMQQAESLIQEVLGKPVSCQTETDLAGSREESDGQFGRQRGHFLTWSGRS